ncbi:hypothetical protein [Bacillus gobiensis]|uniref:Uncharacterized protein n=1 Tax=Bacillus gobiensis TaxID=1441095 RepID=A0A0M5JDX8_9BACI|nr:hypothetical protein [Bacillus gobiensis]ALC80439.1 hypothetical protein AM592_01695 [Bacillus gobiensis]
MRETIEDAIDYCLDKYAKEILSDLQEYGVIIEGPYGFSQSMIKCTDYLEKKVKEYNKKFGLHFEVDFLGSFYGLNEDLPDDYFHFVMNLAADLNYKEFSKNAILLREQYIDTLG